MEKLQPNHQPKIELVALDFVRLVAILQVVFIHSWQDFGAVVFGSKFVDIASHGARGVDLFFFHTAFVLTLSFMRQEGGLHFTAANAVKMWTSFMCRRFFRLAPLLILCVLLLADASCRWSEKLAYISFLNGWTPLCTVRSPLWSIAVEWQLYIFLPLIFFVQDKNFWRRILWVAFIGFGFSAVYRYVFFEEATHYFHSQGLGYMAYQNLMNYWPHVTAGIAGAYFYLHLHQRKIWRHPSCRLLGPLCTLAFLGLWIGLASFSRVFEVRLYMGIFLWLALPLILIGVCASRPLWPCGAVRAVASIARWSYSIYLFHIVGIVWVEKLNLFWMDSPIFSALSNYVLLFVGLAIVGELCWRFIEKPGIRLGKKIADSILRL